MCFLASLAQKHDQPADSAVRPSLSATQVNRSRSPVIFFSVYFSKQLTRWVFLQEEQVSVQHRCRSDPLGSAGDLHLQ